MSTFWTPSGERPIPRDEPAAPASPGRPPQAGAQPEPDEEEMQAEIRAMQEQMLRTPAAIVVANHCIGLIELAALHLGALAGILDAVGARMGDNGPALRQALNQMRMAFIEAKNAVALSGDANPPG